ncbi:MAG TPA: hypothetical protein VGK89_11455 [Candidatus Eisenbacteria bacterium]|jgi:hypothetical protein
MNYSQSHVDDQALLKGLKEAAAKERASIAALRALVAELDARGLQVPEAVRELLADVDDP